MIPVIIDLQILESHYQRNFQRPNLYQDALDSASYFVFEKHGVEKEQFHSSFTYYSLDLPSMYLLLETTLDSINVRVANKNIVQ
ncbi:MAG: DUF4296 domain-containing protein [Crocinitomicaceae bacterium]|nr:DUF4296 domain-containing protein [Crocinitomicaceae bacterium]